MRSGFFLSRVQWRRGCPEILSPSWASGQTVSTAVSSLCRDRPVVYWFSQMYAQNLCLFGLIACLSVPPPLMASGLSAHKTDPLSPLQAYFLISTLQPGVFHHSYSTDPLVPFLILNMFPLSPPSPNLLCFEVPRPHSFPAARLLPCLGSLNVQEVFSGRQGLGGAVTDRPVKTGCCVDRWACLGFVPRGWWRPAGQSLPG